MLATTHLLITAGALFGLMVFVNAMMKGKIIAGFTTMVLIFVIALLLSLFL